nr:MAG: DNA pilot protein [Microvirus sp.]
MVWPAVIAGASNLIGGLIGQSQQNVNAGRAQDAYNDNIALQKEFAQTGVTWRARDVIRAAAETGIHPLSLLGVSGGTYTPQTLTIDNANPLGDAIAKGGQEIGRAMAASASEAERRALVTRLDGLTLERGQLENELLKVQIEGAKRNLTAPAVGPAMPISDRSSIPGQGNAVPGSGHVERGVFPSVGYARVADGGLAVIPAKQFQERTEDYSYMPLMWVVRELALPHLQASKYPPPESVERLKPHHVWSFGADGVWRQVYGDNLYPDRHLPAPKSRGSGWFRSLRHNY